MTCEIFDTEAALAAELGRRLVDAIRRQPGLVLGLPTGRSTLPLYAELIRLTQADQVDWSSVRTFNLDEFVGLGTGDPGSFRTFMECRLFHHVNIAPAHIGFLDGRAPDLAIECDRYERAIHTAGGLDVVILGIGANGHVGFNEPADALVARTHRATLDAPTRAANALWFDGELSRVPHDALTMGMATILQARALVLIATGEGKAEAVARMLDGNVTPRVPASFVHLHAQATVMLDQPATGR